ncbi:hypothetical protein [Kribbella jiaozuonensis]|uniref:Uncharacterized protein n=1 Tax=Kribbella jiaozuonensis TaxID=2575441 RepID=A0A4V5UVS7_9ACTN|nr:hypothetical protein [Kribbella jiaozuonensis]TKK74213.1 hypothetical protein FDA38_36045 [Kribbella jiaozuonensis]
MPEHDPEQELGPKITSALHNQAVGQTHPQNTGLAREARRRVHRRRQTWSIAAGAVLVAAAIGGVWSFAGGGASQVASSNSNSSGDSKAEAPNRTQGLAPSNESAVAGCPVDHPILKAPGPDALPPGTGLDVNTPVTGLRACRYGFAEGGTGLLGQESFNAATAQQVVNEIKVLPERNVKLPVFKCAPQVAKPSEAIVLRFDTAAGIREIWVEYDGCQSAGFFTGTHTYGLFSAPLKLFMTGSVRPSGGTYLDALKDW